MDKKVIETRNGKINAIFNFPKETSNKTILCIHGFCSDCRIFNYLSIELAKNGFNVCSIDLPGHGESYGEKGDPDFEKALSSINEIINDLKRDHKVYILAHSLGCTYGLWCDHRFRNIDGMILLSPYIRIPSIKKRSGLEPSNTYFMYLLLRKIFSPKTKMHATNLPNFLKVGGKEIEQMTRDKKLNFAYSYRYIVDVLALKNTKIANLSDVDAPLLIIHGKKDKNVYPQVSEAFYKLVKSKDKKIEILDCDHWFYHAVFYNQDDAYSEEDRMKVITLICNWVKSH
jgi:alpha-beta hydrolase superfamily lysophospholipase